ncbi:MAG: hypothetical protein U0271_33480 [Polyangiaceae bacterium]
MATVDNWSSVEEALARLETFDVLKPTLVVMRKLVAHIKRNPSFSDVLPRISMATLVLHTKSKKQCLWVAWKGDTEYEITTADQHMNILEARMVTEEELIPTLIERLSELQE